MKNLKFKRIITQSTDNTKQYNERSRTTTTLTSWQDARIIMFVLHTHTHELSLPPPPHNQISWNNFIAVYKIIFSWKNITYGHFIPKQCKASLPQECGKLRVVTYETYHQEEFN
jgi:hypothetical protein